MNRKHITILLSLFLCGSMFAQVNLKNGNFYKSFTDIKIYPKFGAIEDITRTYNSKSTYVGIFGYGWGSMIQTFLHSYPDGSIVVFQHGSGESRIFNSALTTEDMIEYMVDELIETSLNQGDINNNPNAILERREKLFKDLDYRIKQWDHYVKKGLLEYETALPEGMEWESFERGNEIIIKTKNGFDKKESNEIESFNSDGKLVKIDKGFGNWASLVYNDGKLSKIINADSTEFVFKFNEAGFVKRIEIDESISKYSYNYAMLKYEGKELKYYKNVAGDMFKFNFDENHNMTKIIYNPVRIKGVPEDAMTMEYEPRTGWISKITDRDGNVTEYSYDVFYNTDGSKSDKHYGTKVTVTDEYGNKKTNSYEYIIGVKETGERYSQKIITDIQGIKTETTYDELCEKPIEITKGYRKTTFKYNNRCLLTEKLSDSDSVYMKYHPTSEKITYVKNDDGTYEFTYDENLNLIYVEKNKKDWVQLVYDDKGKIISMTDGSATSEKGRTLTFEYNKLGKPNKIVLKDVGTINVTYDNSGEIERVESESGHKMALQVTQAFQSLLQLVKPSGVNLGM